MDLMKHAAEIFQQKLGASAKNLDISTIISALSGLLGDGKGNLDLANIISKLNANGLSGMLNSWLGDGANKSISTSQITEIFGAGAINNFASKLDLNKETAASGLADMLPQLLDQQSSGGSLLENVGADGLLGMAKKFF